MRHYSELSLNNESEQCRIAGPFSFLCSQITKNWLLFARVVLSAGLLENGVTVQWKCSHFQNVWPIDTRIEAKQYRKKGKSKFHCVSLHSGMCYFHHEIPLPICPLHPLLAPGGLSDGIRLALGPWRGHNTCQTPGYSPLMSSQTFLSDFFVVKSMLKLHMNFHIGQYLARITWMNRQGLCCSLQVQDCSAGVHGNPEPSWPFIAQVRD